MGRPGNASGRAAWTRGAAFFGFWIVLMPSAKPGDLAIGLLAALAATWTSVHFLPPETGRLRLGALLALVPRFLWRSVLAGSDVARRALDPRLPLNPGFVRCPVGIPPGPARNAFTTITSLMPGSVPCGENDGVLVYHCLDTGQPIAEQVCEEERVLFHALASSGEHD